MIIIIIIIVSFGFSLCLGRRKKLEPLSLHCALACEEREGEVAEQLLNPKCFLFLCLRLYVKRSQILSLGIVLVQPYQTSYQTSYPAGTHHLQLCLPVNLASFDSLEARNVSL